LRTKDPKTARSRLARKTVEIEEQFELIRTRQSGDDGAASAKLRARFSEIARAYAIQISDAEFAFRRLVAVVGVMDDKDARGILDAIEPMVSDVVVTRNASPRAMAPDVLAELARSIFGEDRVVVEPSLDTAVETAVALVEQTDDPEEPLAGGGVLITGSVVTAGEARTLFGKEPA
jgi:dihydrofolate synthase/folylpolyglutamate synthase